MKPAPFGLRSTLYLYDTVVEQHVFWEQNTEWTEVLLHVPTPDEQAVASLRWIGTVIELRDDSGEIHCFQADDAVWVWKGQGGVSIHFDRIQMQKAKRTSGEAWADVALLVMMLP